MSNENGAKKIMMFRNPAYYDNIHLLINRRKTKSSCSRRHHKILGDRQVDCSTDYCTKTYHQRNTFMHKELPPSECLSAAVS